LVKDKNKATDGILANNKKAFHDYAVLDRIEAGIQLQGTEVKSCRAHSITMADSYVKIEKGEALLLNVHIATYEQGNQFNHDPKRQRRLLMHKREMLKLTQQIKEKGCTLVPLKFYLKKSLIKVELGICKGKTFGDKRDTLRQRQDDMDSRRAIRMHK